MWVILFRGCLTFEELSGDFHNKLLLWMALAGLSCAFFTILLDFLTSVI
jgi:hypothetical protein|tara:strand:- start:2446 stop:2592 length:147 start_codon:yes stop_codon:yes gene_type:complete